MKLKLGVVLALQCIGLSSSSVFNKNEKIQNQTEKRAENDLPGKRNIAWTKTEIWAQRTEDLTKGKTARKGMFNLLKNFISGNKK